MVSAKAAHYKHEKKSTLGNQSESLINEAIALTSMDDRFVKLIEIGEPNNLYLQLARDGN